MTPTEVVACVKQMQRNVENVLLFLPTWRNEPTDDDEVAMYAEIAFHEAGKLLDLCAPKTCGTCADWERSFPNLPPKSGSRGRCNSETSECAMVTDGETWPANHGCPHWRAKDGAQ